MRAPHESVDVAGALSRLPDEYLVAALGDVWFVAGPTGAYIIRVDDPSDRARTEETGEVASRTRKALSQQLQWVPFVHALVVTDEPLALMRATCVPPRMLIDVLTEGRRLIERATLAKIDEVLSRRILDGVADEIDPSTGDVRMGRCDPSRPQTA